MAKARSGMILLWCPYAGNSLNVYYVWLRECWSAHVIRVVRSWSARRGDSWEISNWVTLTRRNKAELQTGGILLGSMQHKVLPSTYFGDNTEGSWLGDKVRLAGQGYPVTNFPPYYKKKL